MSFGIQEELLIFNNLITCRYWISLISSTKWTPFCTELKGSVLQNMFRKALFIETGLTNNILCKSHFIFVYCTIILLCYYFDIHVHVFELILMCVYYGPFELYVLSTVDTDTLGQTKLTWVTNVMNFQVTKISTYT